MTPLPQILDLLWGLAHLPQLSREMVELALEAHSSILIESYHTKEAEKRTYINKCIEDIRKVRACNSHSEYTASLCIGHVELHVLVDVVGIICMYAVKTLLFRHP